MLRSRSRAVTSKQTLMADHHSSQQSQTQNPSKPVSSFLSSPKFKGFITQNHHANESLISPNSILDTRPFSAVTSPFWYDKRNQLKSPTATLTSPRGIPSGNKQPWENSETGANIGLKIIDALENEKTTENSPSKPATKKVIVASKLRVQIPPVPVSPAESPKSPTDFGIKFQNSQQVASGSSSSCTQTREPSHVLKRQLSVSEMEQSEEYTCVIAHGPNPRTTHIFDNFIVERYCSLSDQLKSPTPRTDESNFLSNCYTCKNRLEQTKDIYIYRGEKAFCSRDCRYQEMLIDGAENSEFDA